MNSMDDKYDPASDYLRMTADEIKQKKEDTYEAAVVKRVLQKAVLPHDCNTEHRVRSHDSENKLTMAGLCQATGFPVWLQPIKVLDLPNLAGILFKNMTRIPAYKTYDAMCGRTEVPEYFSEVVSRGVVFQWDGVNKFMVLHDRLALPTIGMLFDLGAKRLVLETLDTFVAALGPSDTW